MYFAIKSILYIKASFMFYGPLHVEIALLYTLCMSYVNCVNIVWKPACILRLIKSDLGIVYIYDIDKAFFFFTDGGEMRW